MKYFFKLLIILFVQFGAAQNSKAPQFPGGKDSLANFISRNLKFPEVYKSDSSFKNCKVQMQFLVDTNGVISDSKIVRSCLGFDLCDLEAIRLMKIMPLWEPAVKNNIKYKRSTSITFEFIND